MPFGSRRRGWTSEEIVDQVRDQVTKRAVGGHLFFAVVDAYAVHAELKARGVELTEEPTEQSYRIDFGLRDRFGDHVRVAQVKAG